MTLLLIFDNWFNYLLSFRKQDLITSNDKKEAAMIDQKTNKDSNLTQSDSRMRIYILDGDPTTMSPSRFNTDRSCDSVRRSKTRDSITLTCQHDDFPFYRGPLQICVTFYFHVPLKPTAKKHGSKSGDRQWTKPNLVNCVKYIEEAAQGILFQENTFITSVRADKYYDSSPRTEFYIVEL